MQYVNNEVLSDVQFVVEGIPIHAHKVQIPSFFLFLLHFISLLLDVLSILLQNWCLDFVLALPLFSHHVYGGIYGEQRQGDRHTRRAIQYIRPAAAVPIHR
jgi:hypothetical protein